MDAKTGLQSLKRWKEGGAAKKEEKEKGQICCGREGC